VHSGVDGASNYPIGAFDSNPTEQKIFNGQGQGITAAFSDFQTSIEAVEIKSGGLANNAILALDSILGGKFVVGWHGDGLQVGLPIQIGCGHEAFAIRTRGLQQDEITGHITIVSYHHKVAGYYELGVYDLFLSIPDDSD